jgi:tetratricopeptide (TPR) repeat protein
LEKVLVGSGTYREFFDRLAKDPLDIEAATELGKKYEDLIDQDKALEFYKKALTAHASGAKGFTSYGLVKVPCDEFASYSVARYSMAARGQGSPTAIKEFIEKHPQSPLLQQAYVNLSSYYSRYGSSEDAAKFFEEYISRFPDNSRTYWSYARRILRDGGDAEKGAALMDESIRQYRKELVGASLGPRIRDYEKLHALKGDEAGSVEVFDEEFVKLLGRINSTEVAYFVNFWLDKNILIPEAEKYAELARALAPEFPQFLSRVAEIYLRLDKKGKALAIFGPDYVQENWDNAGNLWSYASFWAKKELNLEDALKAARRSVEPGPSEYAYIYWEGLSDVLLKLKNYEEALQAAEKALELAPASYSTPYKAKVEQLKKLIKKE